MLVLQSLLGYVLLGAMGMGLLAVCYLPIGFLLRKKVSPWRQIPWFLLVVCGLVIVDATILIDVIAAIGQGRSVFTSYHSLNLIPFQFITETWAMGARLQFTQNLANVLMFVPLGVLFPIVFPKARTLGQAALRLLCCSVAIEFVQFWIGRSADIDDVLLNTLGGVLGYLLYALFDRWLGKRGFWKKMKGVR